MGRLMTPRPRSFASQQTRLALVCMGVAFVIVSLVLGIVSWVFG